LAVALEDGSGTALFREAQLAACMAAMAIQRWEGNNIDIVEAMQRNERWKLMRRDGMQRRNTIQATRHDKELQRNGTQQQDMMRR
jgi:hypothetical protein